MVSTYLTPEAARKFRQGVPWATREEIVSIEGEPRLGEPVRLMDEAGHLLGVGDVDLESRQAIRRLGLPEESADGLIQAHLRRALQRRASWVVDPRYCRLVNDDGDGLPGLVVDRYDSHIVIQTSSRAMDARVPEIARNLEEMAGVSSALLRNDGTGRAQAGLSPQRPHVLFGAPPRWVRVLELGARFTVDLFSGQGTGYFYDQRQIRRAVSRIARGARVLDPCCYVGGLFVHAGLAGAKEIVAFDVDADSLELARENAEANGISAKTQLEKADAFEALQRIRQAFDLVLLDPPALPGPAPLPRFRELVRLCVRATRRGGKMVAAGYHPPLLPGQLDSLISEACEAEDRVAFRISRPGLPVDFPTLLGPSASEYLSALVLEIS